MQKITKNIWGVKVIGILFLVLTLFLFPFPKRQANAWDETFITNPMQSALDWMLEQLDVILTGVAKQAAVKMISQNVYSSVSGEGGGSGAKFITNWEGALEDDPQAEAASYIESMSANSTQMRGSSFYESADDSLIADFEGVGENGLAQYFHNPRFIDSAKAQAFAASGGNYTANLNNIVKSITSQGANFNKCSVTYTGNPANMFADGTFKNFSKFMSGNNTPWAYQTCMQKAYEDKLASLQKIAATKAVAYQGFIGTGQGKSISYPGILVKEKVANVENMGNEVIVNANGIAEVITSAVMKMGMDAMNNGIGNVQAQVQKSSTNVSNKINTQMQNQTQNYGPGALYGNSSGN